MNNKEQLRILLPSDIDSIFLLAGDNTGGKLLYLYLDEAISIYSENEKEFFEEIKKRNLLRFNYESFSFLLLNNVVPYPKTIYKNVYILSYGDQVKIDVKHHKFVINFEFDFPYNENKSNHTSLPSTGILLDNLALVAEKRIDNNSILSLSSGKDSICILLGLLESGKKIETFTYKSPGQADESEFVHQLSRKYNFKNEVFELNLNSKKLFTENYDLFYSTINIPSLDQAQLSYLFFNRNFFKDRTIIDGSGSDIYVGHIPTKEQYYMRYISLEKLSSSFIKYQHSSSVMKNTKIQSFPFKSTAANNGLFSWFTIDELTKILNFKLDDTSSYWINYENKLNNYIDYRAMTRGRFLDTEVFMRKVRNYALLNKVDIFFPWTDSGLIDYYFNLPQDYKYDLKSFTNKILIRKLLSEKIGYQLPKKGFDFDLVQFLLMFKEIILGEIISNPLFNTNTKIYIDKLYKLLESKPYQYVAKRKLQMLFQFSCFINRHKGLL